MNELFIKRMKELLKDGQVRKADITVNKALKAIGE